MLRLLNCFFVVLVIIILIGLYKKSPSSNLSAPVKYKVSDNNLSAPVKYKVSDNYGYRDDHPILHKPSMHKGIDIVVPIGTPIHAQGDGIITFIGQKSGYGNYIVIKHTDRISTAYAHLSGFVANLKLGSIVKSKDVIGYVGITGRSTGPHLHLEVLEDGKQIDPMKYKDQSIGGI